MAAARREAATEHRQVRPLEGQSSGWPLCTAPRRVVRRAGPGEGREARRIRAFPGSRKGRCVSDPTVRGSPRARCARECQGFNIDKEEEEEEKTSARREALEAVAARVPCCGRGLCGSWALRFWAVLPGTLSKQQGPPAFGAVCHVQYLSFPTTTRTRECSMWWQQSGRFLVGMALPTVVGKYPCFYVFWTHNGGHWRCMHV